MMKDGCFIMYDYYTTPLIVNTMAGVFIEAQNAII